MFVEQSQIGTGKTRNGKLTDKLMSLLEAVGQETGVHFVVVSGGQSAKHTPETYKKAGGWTGSHRHDEGNAADLKAYTVNSDGSRHYLNFDNPTDQKLWGKVVQLSVAGGATGIGAGTHYMGPETVHIGFGKPATWGDGEKSANTPAWLHEAYTAGQHTPPVNIPDTSTANGAPTPMPGRPAGLMSQSATVQPASFGVRGRSRLDAMNPGADGQAFFDQPSMAMLPPSDQIGQPTISMGTGRGGGLGNLLDPRTASLLSPSLPATRTPSLMDTRSEQAAARVSPVLPSNDYGVPPASLAETRAEQAAARGAVRPVLSATAPTPMPGRPSALNPQPEIAPTPYPPLARTAEAPQIAPEPRQRPASFGSMSEPAQAIKPLLRLPSGKYVEAGLMPSSDGNHVLSITDDGNGNAVIKKLSNPGEIPGVLDPLRSANSNTVAGGIIRAQLPKVIADSAGSAGDNVGYAADNLKSSALDAATGLGKAAAASGVGDLVGNVFGGFGNMFGGGASTAVKPKLAAPTVDETRAEQTAARKPILATTPAPTSWSPWGASVIKPVVPSSDDLGYSPATAPVPAPVPAYRKPVVASQVSNAPKVKPLNPVQQWFEHTPLGAAMTPPSLIQLPVAGANAANPIARAFGQTPIGRLLSLAGVGNSSIVGPVLGKSFPNAGQLTMTSNNGAQVIGDHLNGSPRGLTVTGDPWFDSVRGL